MYQILSQSVRFCRLYQKTFWCFFRFTVYSHLSLVNFWRKNILVVLRFRFTVYSHLSLVNFWRKNILVVLRFVPYCTFANSLYCCRMIVKLHCMPHNKLLILGMFWCHFEHKGYIQSFVCYFTVFSSSSCSHF